MSRATSNLQLSQVHPAGMFPPVYVSICDRKSKNFTRKKSPFNDLSQAELFARVEDNKLLAERITAFADGFEYRGNRQMIRGVDSALTAGLVKRLRQVRDTLQMSLTMGQKAVAVQKNLLPTLDLTNIAPYSTYYNTWLALYNLAEDFARRYITPEALANYNPAPLTAQH